MTRSRESGVAWLAVLVVFAASFGGGCGRDLPPRAPRAVPAVQQPEVSLPAAPRPFAAPEGASPLPDPAPKPLPSTSQSVQVQYAQAAGQQSALAAPQSASIYAPQPAAHIAPPVRAAAAQQTVSSPAAHPARTGQTLAQQTLAVTERATAMAKKGMLYAAQEELIAALESVARAADEAQGTSWHAMALAAGWTALDEARDFTPQAGRAASPPVSDIIKSHRTTILQVAGEVPPSVAQQHYLGYAQQQLALAVAGEPAASQTLHLLGRVHAALAGSAHETQTFHSQRALALYQAALAVDPRNYQAANELGVLLASSGQLAEAKRALLHSATIQPHPATWHNLATVHRRLGESQLAAMAENERRLLMAGGAQAAGTQRAVTWVDAATFAAAGRSEEGGQRLASSTPGMNNTQSQRR